MKILLFLFLMCFACNNLFASDYHVLESRDDGRAVTVVFHIPVPNETNSAGVNLRTVVSEQIKPRLEDGTYGTFQSQLQNITAPELTSLRNGELYERVETVGFLAADTNLEKQTKIDNRFTALSTGFVNKIRERFKFYGKSRNVP